MRACVGAEEVEEAKSLAGGDETRETRISDVSSAVTTSERTLDKPEPPRRISIARH